MRSGTPSQIHRFSFDHPFREHENRWPRSAVGPRQSPGVRPSLPLPCWRGTRHTPSISPSKCTYPPGFGPPTGGATGRPRGRREFPRERPTGARSGIPGPEPGATPQPCLGTGPPRAPPRGRGRRRPGAVRTPADARPSALLAADLPLGLCPLPAPWSGNGAGDQRRRVDALPSRQVVMAGAVTTTGSTTENGCRPCSPVASR